MFAYLAMLSLYTGAGYLGDLLKVTYSLQELDMGNNACGDDGMAFIADGLQHNDTVTHLMVENCGFSAKGNKFKAINNS